LKNRIPVTYPATSAVNFTPTSMACLFVEAGSRGCEVDDQTEHGQMIAVNVTDCDVPLRDAVTATADSPLGGALSATTVNVPVDDEGATVTEAGTVRTELLLESDTVAPPLGAAAERVTVQALLDPELRVVGLQVRAVTRTGAIRVKVVVWEAVFKVAVIVALWFVVRVPAVAVKMAELAAAGTVTEAGTVRAGLPLVRATVLPPVGAA